MYPESAEDITVFFSEEINACEGFIGFVTLCLEGDASLCYAPRV
jgi:hypothetical protein